MRISDFCYAVLTVTIAVTTARVYAEDKTDSDATSILNRSIRAAAIPMSKFPLRPKYQIYRRASRFNVAGGRHALPLLVSSTKLTPISKYWSKKKFKKNRMPSYYYGSKKKRQGNKRYTRRYKSRYNTIKNVYNNPNVMKHEPSGFGEPPIFEKGYGEPPVDEYGAPLKRDVINTIKKDVPMELYNDDSFFDPDDPRFQNWVDSHNVDNVKSHSKRKPYATIPADLVESTNPILYSQHNEDEHSLIGYNNNDEVFKFGRKVRGKKRVAYKPKPPKITKVTEEEEEEIVGGRYAEPPARYVQRAPSANHRNKEYIEDADMSGSEPVSSYVNYKNSNMAFSPQNLNDAFSIVD